MKLVTLDEYSGMNRPSLAECFIFCISLGRKHDQLAVVFFLLTTLFCHFMLNCPPRPQNESALQEGILIRLSPVKIN